MVLQGLMIAGLGMGGVFFFLFLMVCAMHLLGGFASNEQDKLKTVAAIAAALKNKQ